MKSSKSIYLRVWLLVAQILYLPILFVAAEAGSPLPCLGTFSTHEEAEEFLGKAKIIGSEGVSVGVTLPRKVTLEKDGRKSSAVFKPINVHKGGITPLRTGPEFDFKDSWKYEVGAYLIDRILNLNMVPPTVERFYDGKKGSLQLWVDGCMTEDARVQKNAAPPDPRRWGMQMATLRVFDNLIYNIDRNQGNVLITPDWSLLLIDHSRTFKNVQDLRTPEDLMYFSRSLMDALGKLEKKKIQKRAGKYLTGYEIDMTLKRRDKILELYRKAADRPDAVYP